MNMKGGTFGIMANGAKFHIFKSCDKQGKRDYYARAINLRLFLDFRMKYRFFAFAFIEKVIHKLR